MFTRRNLAKAVGLLALLVMASAPRAWAVESAKPNDVARYLAVWSRPRIRRSRR